MNGPFQVAQAGGTAISSTNGSPVRIYKLTKPLTDQAVVVNLGYDQKAKIDFSAIANEKITLVHIGEKLIILFDNESTVTVEPFFKSRADGPGNDTRDEITVEMAPGRDISVKEFAALFPITTDASVLPAAGGNSNGNAQASGAYFSPFSVDPLDPVLLNKLAPQEELGNFVLEIPTGGNVIPDQAGDNLRPDELPPSALLDRPTILVGVGQGLVVDESFIPLVGSQTLVAGTPNSNRDFRDFAGAFTINVPAGVKSVIYGLKIDNSTTNLIDVATGQSVRLVSNGSGEVDGVITINNTQITVFTLTVDGAGRVEFTVLQAGRQFVHSADVLEGISPNAGLISLTVTVTDNNGAIASASLDIGPLITVFDDVPRLSVAANPEVTIALDETSATTTAAAINTGTILKGDDPDVPNTPDAAGYISHAVSSVPLVSNVSHFGADGPLGNNATTATSYAFVVNAQAPSSGLFVTDGSPINLQLVGGVVVGVVSGGAFDGKAAFAISIDSATGVATIEQYLSLQHPINTNPNDLVFLKDGSLSVQVTITDGDGDQASKSADVSHQISFADDGPTNNETTQTQTVFEDGLTNANSNNQSVGNSEPGHTEVTATYTAAQILSLVNIGSDGPGSVKLAGVALEGVLTGLQSQGVAVTYHAVSGTEIDGVAGGRVVFTLVDDGAGNFVFTLKDQVDHLPLNAASGDNDASVTIDIARAFVVTDADGDWVQLDNGATVAIENDIPVTASNTLVAVDEDDLASGNHDTTSPGDDAASSLTGTLHFLVGADEPATVGFASLNATAVIDTLGHAVTAGGHALSYLWDSTTNTLYATPDGTAGHAAFKVSVNPATGAYSFSLLGQVDHPGHDADGLNNGPDTAYEDNININLTYTVTDFDGDSATGTLSISIDDDMPILAAAPVNQLTNGDFSAGTFASNPSFGGVAGPGDVPGWVVSNSSVEPPAPGGLQVERVFDGYLGLHSSTHGNMIDMGASPGNIQISQQLSGLTAGQTYAIEFEAGAPYPATAELQVLWNNVVIGTIDPTGPMTSYSYVVTATGIAANDQITFREVGLGHAPIPGEADEGYHGTYLANVAIVATSVVDEDGLTGPLSFGNHDGQVGDNVVANTDGDNNEATATGNLNIKWGADNARQGRRYRHRDVRDPGAGHARRRRQP